MSTTQTDQYVSEREAAKITSMSIPWFRLKRQQGGGVPFVKCGRSVRYSLTDIAAYMAARRIVR